MTLFRTKIGVVLLALVFVGAFFCASKMKAHRRALDTARGTTVLAGVHPNMGEALAPKVSVLTQTVAHADKLAEDSSSAHLAGRAQGYDEAGDVYRRRPVPEAIDPVASTAPDHAMDFSGGEVDVSTIQLHSHHAALPTADSPSKFIDTVSGLLPHVGNPLGVSAAPALARPLPKPTRFVPFGRLIKAELVMTLESTQDEMPLIALVTEPVYNNGLLVIPAGTELHSMARPDRIRDRIVSVTTWHMIFPREGRKPNGRQLTFEGIALDREDKDGNGLTWGLTDGSYGLRGRALHADQTAETLMLFAAEALKSASNTSMERQQTIYGQQVEINARNDALAGGQAVLSRFAQNIEREIERNGVYVQVPAGKEFYVYPRQVIDPDRADISENIARVE